MAYLCFGDAFLSVVADRHDRNVLLVRAHRAADILALFPDALVVEGQGSRYRCRARVGRADVAVRLAERMMKLNYAAFCPSVPEPARRACYGALEWAIRQAQASAAA